MSEFNASNFKKEEGGQGPDIIGTTEFTSPYFMVPPSGTTAERPSGCAPGTLRFNTDIGSLEYFKGDTLGWESIVKTTPNLDGGVRALFAGGYTPSPSPGVCVDNVDKITISTVGNATDWCNLTEAKQGGGNLGDRTRAVYAGGRVSTTPGGSETNKIEFITFSTQGNYADSSGDLSASIMCSGLSNSTRGIFAGFIDPYADTIDYITIQSIGNAQDFGNLTAVKGYTMQCASSTRGLFFGGINNPSNPSINTIDYVTIASTGDAADFGDITGSGSGGRYEGAAFSNSTRAVQAGGYGPGYTDEIEYVTIATLGNSVEFGELSALNGTGKGSGSSPTRGVLGGGYVHPSSGSSNILEYIQFATTGDSIDFGDLSLARRMPQSGCSNGHGGL